MSQQAERRVGTVIGAKWRVDALLGSGSMAAVYAVTHRNGARAALKILHPTLCTDPAVCERFLGEGYLTNSVKHQGIVRVLDDGVTDDGCVFLVMDLLEGDTLEVLRQHRGNRIELVEVLDIADKLMDVLHAVHTAGIIHRDLKPQNVFVCNDGTVKLLDFGVARVFDRASQSKLSMFGLVLGTPSFMSPEQALGSRDKVDHRSDIWSLGATMFTALTGETVHLGANVQAKLLAAATVKARSIGMVMPALPAPIAAAIDMALRFKKEDRWQSVDAFRRALRDARVQLGLGRPQSVLPPPMSESFGDKTVKMSAPPAPPVPKPAGSGATLIGGITVDPSAPARPRSNPPPLPSGPPRSRMTSTHPMPERPDRAGPSNPPPPLHSHPPPSPLAVVRTPARAMDALREGSIPAYAPDDTAQSIAAMGVRKKGTVAIWIAAFALAAAAISGIGFFAVKKGPLATPEQGATPEVAPTIPVTPMSATPPPAPSTPGTIVIPPPEPSPNVPLTMNTANATKDAAPAVRPAIATTSQRARGGAGHGSRTSSQSRSNQGSGTTPTPDPPPTATTPPVPTVPPDPFGTPE